MSLRDFLTATMVIFAILAIAHAIRLFNGIPVSVGSMTVPTWVSWIGIAAGLYLSHQAYKHRR